MTATEDLFTPIHKAIRAMIYNVGGRLQSNDFGDLAASAPLLADLEHEFTTALSAGCILCIVHHHGTDEENVLFPSLSKFDPALVTRLVEEHHAFNTRLAALTSHAHEILKMERASDRIAAGVALNREANEFFAVYLAHMNLEENVLVPMMRERYTDEQMRTMRGTIMGGMPPERLAAILRWMLPAISLQELTDMARGIRAGSPPPVVAFIGGIAADSLPAERWNTVRERVGW
jgi:hemerythrin superfamily protein